MLVVEGHIAAKQAQLRPGGQVLDPRLSAVILRSHENNVQVAATPDMQPVGREPSRSPSGASCRTVLPQRLRRGGSKNTMGLAPGQPVVLLRPGKARERADTLAASSASFEAVTRRSLSHPLPPSLLGEDEHDGAEHGGNGASWSVIKERLHRVGRVHWISWFARPDETSFRRSI